MAEKHLHAGHRSRLRARYSKNPQCFEDHELLELILFYAIPQKDTNALAHELLHRFGSLSGVLEASAQQLSSVNGMGESSSQLFLAMMDLIRRYLKEKSVKKRTEDVDSLTKTVGDHFKPEYIGRSSEMVKIIGLNACQQIIGSAVVGEGNFDSSSVDMEKLIDFMIKYRPSYVVLAHNHPSGVGVPSTQDYNATDLVSNFVSSMKCRLLDHIIFDPSGDYLSFRDSGFLSGGERPTYSVRVHEPECSEDFSGREFVKNPMVTEIMAKMENK